MSKRYKLDDVQLFHDLGIYIPKRMLYLGSETFGEDHESGVDGKMAEKLIKNISILEGLGSDPITIVTNNVGGNVMDGLAIFDAIKNCRSYVRIDVYGQAMSMGSVILQAADERRMSANSVQMIHYGTAGAAGHAKTVQKQVEEDRRLDEVVENIYLARIKEKHPSFSKKKLKEMLSFDTFLTAEQSVDLGLCDSVIAENRGDVE
jgi:ATP-dependent Clp protease protease subunit